MLRGFRLAKREITAVALAAVVSAGMGAAAVVACITAPPPELPTIPARRPTILHASVVPPPDQILSVWPATGLTFDVPVELEDSTQPFLWSVFVDYDPLTARQPILLSNGPTPAPPDGGPTIVSFLLDAPDPAFCHRIDFVVANSFTTSFRRTPDGVGGDIVSWLYNAGGGPNGCPVYDAGPVQDGAFPPDAPADGLPVTPGGDR
jgi:hypothetical protein